MQINILFLVCFRTLKDLITGKGFVRFWIGLDDKNHENNWYWIDGKKAIKHETNWNANQPDNSLNKEDCAEVFNHKFKFNDLDCTWKFIALCEID